MWNMFKETLNKSWTLAFAGMTREQILARSTKKATSVISADAGIQVWHVIERSLNYELRTRRRRCFTNYELGLFPLLFYSRCSMWLRSNFGGRSSPAAPKDTSTCWIFKDVTAGPLLPPALRGRTRTCRITGVPNLAFPTLSAQPLTFSTASGLASIFLRSTMRARSMPIPPAKASI